MGATTQATISNTSFVGAERVCTHFGLALNALLAAQRRLVALLLLLWRRIAVGACRAGGGRIRTRRGLRAFVIHCAARAAIGQRVSLVRVLDSDGQLRGSKRQQWAQRWRE